MLNRVTIIINFSLGCLSIVEYRFLEGTEHYMRFPIEVLIVVLIFIMTLLTILNSIQWYKSIKNKNYTSSSIDIIVLISYVFAFIALII